MIRSLLFGFGLLAGMTFGGSVMGESQTVYVSLSGDNKLAWFNLDMETGKLERAGEIATDAGPGPMAVNKKRNLLYLGQRGNKTVAVYKLGVKGTPEFLGKSPILGNPVYLALEPSRKWLLTAHYGEAKAGVYALSDKGLIQGEAVQVLNTDKNPHSIQVDPAGKTVYIPNTGADKIFVRGFDSSTGAIDTSNTADASSGMKSGPRHFAMHPILPEVYFINETDSSISVYEKGGKSGALKHLQTLSTLPKAYEGKNSCADIHITPNGRFLYGSNRGHDSIACFQVDLETGKLSSLGAETTEKTPRAFNIDPRGKFLIAAGQDSGKLAVYRINGETGGLTRTSTVEAGKSPAWVEILSRP